MTNADNNLLDKLVKNAKEFVERKDKAIAKLNQLEETLKAIKLKEKFTYCVFEEPLGPSVPGKRISKLKKKLIEEKNATFFKTRYYIIEWSFYNGTNSNGMKEDYFYISLNLEDVTWGSYEEDGKECVVQVYKDKRWLDVKRVDEHQLYIFSDNSDKFIEAFLSQLTPKEING